MGIFDDAWKESVSSNNEKCSLCDVNLIPQKKFMLVLDHINGISEDNRLEDLRLVCSNCKVSYQIKKS